MKVKVKRTKSLPRNYKSLGLSFETWESLNSGEEVELDSVPKSYESFVDVSESSSAKPSKPASSKGGK